MKRALAIVVAVCTLGVAGLAQFNITGTWTTSVALLPSFELSSTTLTLTYSVAGFSITSTSRFTGTYGYDRQSFALSGALGPFTIAGFMAFDPLTVAYKRAYLKSAFDFGGLMISAGWYHGTGWSYLDTGIGYGGLYGAYYIPYVYGLPYPKIYKPGLADHGLTGLGAKESLLIFETEVKPVFVSVSFIDRHQELVVTTEGGQTQSLVINAWGFNKAYFQLYAIDLCCGITYDFELLFTKAGFTHAKFGFNDLFTLFNLLRADVTITYGVDYKTAALVWEFIGFPATACLNVYGTMTSALSFTYHGFDITCTLGDCSKATFGTAALVTSTATKLFVTHNAATNKYSFAWSSTAPSTGTGLTHTQVGTANERFVVGSTIPWSLSSGVAYVTTPPAGGTIPGGGLWVDLMYKGPTTILPATTKYVYWSEFEIASFTFCGAGCCGDKWTGAITLAWASFYALAGDAYAGTPVTLTATKINPTLFGLSRFAISTTIPIMTSFSLNLGLGHVLATQASTLTLGWTFKF